MGDCRSLPNLEEDLLLFTVPIDIEMTSDGHMNGYKTHAVWKQLTQYDKLKYTIHSSNNTTKRKYNITQYTKSTKITTA
jgi:hypothetical protein